MTTTETETYAILLDAYALTDDENATDETILDAFASFAHECGVTFANVRRVSPVGARFATFATSDVVVAFDATPDDVASYAETNDMPDDAIVRLS